MDPDWVLSGRAGHGGLRAMLVGPAKAAVLDALGSMIASDETLERCWMTRTHFKPGRKLTCYYDVAVEGGPRATPIAVTWLFGGASGCLSELAAADEELSRGKFPTVFDRRWSAGAFGAMLVQAAPLDPVFPSLAGFSDPRRVPETLAAGGYEFGHSAGPYQVWSVRYRPGQRHVLAYRNDHRPAMFVKLYRPGEVGGFSQSVNALADLAAAVGVPGVRPLRPAAVIACADAILYHPVPGAPVSSWMRSARPARWEELELIGRWLRVLHSLPPETPSCLGQRGLDGEIKAVRRACEAMMALRPELGSVAARVIDAARQRLEALDQEPVAVVHGDLKADHLLSGPGGIAVLDGDRCALADPALDVGKLLADLRYWCSWSKNGAAARAEPALLAGYGDAGPRLARARTYAALLLVKMAARRVSVARSDWARRTTDVLALAEVALDEARAP